MAKLSIDSRKVRQAASRATVGSVIVGLLTLACFRLHLNFPTVSLVYLLVVVIQSLAADFASSAVAALVAVVCLDYFFVPPLFSFNVADPYNLLALFSFLTTALVITHFASKARREARASGLQRKRLAALYNLAQQLLAMEPEMSMGKKFLEPFRAVFDARATSLYDAGTGELHVVGDSRGGLPDATREAYIVGRDFDDPASAVSVRCLRAAGRTTGAIGFEGLANPDSETGALATLAAILLEEHARFDAQATPLPPPRRRPTAQLSLTHWPTNSKTRWLRSWQRLAVFGKPDPFGLNRRKWPRWSKARRHALGT